MGFHLYCVTGATLMPEDVAGIDGARVHAVAAAGVAVWASQASAPLRASIDAVRAHNAVVEAAHAAQTPVPLRFGQWLADETAVRECLAERAETWRTQLAELAGTAEYGVRVVDPALENTAQDVRPDRSGTGRAYLESLAGRDSERGRRVDIGVAVAEWLERRLKGHAGSLVLRARVDPLESAHGLVSIAHLVRRADDAVYRSALAAAIEERPELHFLTSGPWPPYSFAS